MAPEEIVNDAVAAETTSEEMVTEDLASSEEDLSNEEEIDELLEKIEPVIERTVQNTD